MPASWVSDWGFFSRLHHNFSDAKQGDNFVIMTVLVQRLSLWRPSKIKFEAILFDLDGTLLDTLADIANSMNAVLSKLGFATYPVDSYRYFVGDGMEHLVRRTVPTEHKSEKTVGKCFSAVKEEYARRWAEKTKPYPGIPELLSSLQEHKITMVVLSNKPDDFAQLTIKKFLPTFDFRIVRGLRPGDAPKPDPTITLQIASELDIHPHRFVYLGDTNTDMQTACAAGMFGVGVLWGFRDAEELNAHGANALVGNPLEVMKFFEN
jgi:phosphoglycolate phosphatase